MIKRLARCIREYKWAAILSPLTMIGEVTMEVLIPLVMAQLINQGVQAGDMSALIKYGLLMMLLALVSLFFGVACAHLASHASTGFGANLRHDIFYRVQDFSFANIDKFSTGSLVTRLTNDVTQVQNFVNMLLRMFLRAPGMLIGALIMAITLKPSLAVVLAVTIPLMLVSVIFIIRTGFPRFGKMQIKVDKLNSTVQENITNVRVVKSFVREDFEKENAT